MPENLSGLSYIPVAPQTIDALADAFDRRPLDTDLPCAGKPAEAMYSVGEDKQYGGKNQWDLENYGSLRDAYCSQCGFAVNCLARALVDKDYYGMHGGASGFDKRKMLRDYRSDKEKLPGAVEDFVAQMREDPRCKTTSGKQRAPIGKAPGTLEAGPLNDIVRSADPESDVFFQAAATLLGRGNKVTDRQISAAVYVGVARMTDAGYSEYRIAEKYHISASRARALMSKIGAAALGVDLDSVGKILGRKPPEEILKYTEDSEEFLALACNMIGVNSFRDNTNLGRRQHIELLRAALINPGTRSSLSTKFGISSGTVRDRVQVMQDRLAQYSDEIMNHILGLDVEELESA